MSKKYLFLILTTLVFLLVSWSPWLTKEFAVEKINHSLGRCGTSLDSVLSFKKELFRANVSVRLHNAFSDTYSEGNKTVTFFGYVSSSACGR